VLAVTGSLRPSLAQPHALANTRRSSGAVTQHGTLRCTTAPASTAPAAPAAAATGTALRAFFAGLTSPKGELNLELDCEQAPRWSWLPCHYSPPRPRWVVDVFRVRTSWLRCGLPEAARQYPMWRKVEDGNCQVMFCEFRARKEQVQRCLKIRCNERD
jgi:hypothetical protein